MRAPLSGIAAQTALYRWLDGEGWQVARAGVRSKFQTCDLFGVADALAIRYVELEGRWEVWVLQITSRDRAGKSRRRRLLLDFKCPPSWRKTLVVHEVNADPADRKRTLDYWRLEDLVGDVWQKPVAVQFDLEALRAEVRAEADQRHREEMDEIRARIAKQKQAP